VRATEKPASRTEAYEFAIQVRLDNTNKDQLDSDLDEMGAG
jgi:hypothetical protein